MAEGGSAPGSGAALFFGKHVCFQRDCDEEKRRKK